MNWKQELLKSTEIWTGAGLVVAGIAAMGLGVHSILAQALAPFGIGLVLSEILTRAVKTTRERVKIRIRRDDD